MACDIGPIMDRPAYVAVELDYNEKPAYLLLPDGRCLIDQPRLATFATQSITWGSDHNSMNTAVLMARSVLTASGWPIDSHDSLPGGWTTIGQSTGLWATFNQDQPR